MHVVISTVLSLFWNKKIIIIENTNWKMILLQNEFFPIFLCSFVKFPFSFFFSMTWAFIPVSCCLSCFFYSRIKPIRLKIYARLVIRQLHYFTCKTELHRHNFSEWKFLKRIKWALSCTSFFDYSASVCLKLMVVTMEFVNGISTVWHAST